MAFRFPFAIILRAPADVKVTSHNGRNRNREPEPETGTVIPHFRFRIRFRFRLLPLLPTEDFLEERQRARIARLAQPEHGLLAHFGVPVRPCDLDEPGHAFVPRELAEREPRLLLHLRLRIVVERARDRGDGLPSRLLAEPEQ